MKSIKLMALAVTQWLTHNVTEMTYHLPHELTLLYLKTQFVPRSKHFSSRI